MRVRVSPFAPILYKENTLYLRRECVNKGVKSDTFVIARFAAAFALDFPTADLHHAALSFDGRTNMSAKKTTNGVPTLAELRKKWEKLQPKFSSGRVRNPRRWCLQERRRLKKAAKEARA